MSFRVPEEKRITSGRLRSNPALGNNGAFEFRIGNAKLLVIASDGAGWDHVSVSVIESSFRRCPTWEEMCKVKDMFWSEEDCVVQYHPPKAQYVNNHEHCLHLWKPTYGALMPQPDVWMVGIK